MIAACILARPASSRPVLTRANVAHFASEPSAGASDAPVRRPRMYSERIPARPAAAECLAPSTMASRSRECMWSGFIWGYEGGGHGGGGGAGPGARAAARLSLLSSSPL